MPCSYCGEGKVFARGYCQACYWRVRRRGTPERKYIPRQKRCQEQECDREVFAKNLCVYHYARADHPLKASWKLLRSRWRGQYPSEWDTFLTFLEDVGERPTPKHRLQRRERRRQFSKENVHWVHHGTRTDPAYARSWWLKRKYGITEDEYQGLLIAQDGQCAICGGKFERLGVDHCHSNGGVRGLLCVSCNRGLGYFSDSIERLQRAIAYLKRAADEQT